MYLLYLAIIIVAAIIADDTPIAIKIPDTIVHTIFPNLPIIISSLIYRRKVIATTFE